MTLRKTIDWLFNPPLSAPSSTILIRLMAGGVFLSEGILKFVYVNQGVGRFTKIGIPAPAPMAHFVAILEIVGGLLLVSGFLTRLIAIPFVIEMSVLFRRNSESPAIRRIKIVQDGADSGGLKSQSTVVLNLTVLLLF